MGLQNKTILGPARQIYSRQNLVQNYHNRVTAILRYISVPAEPLEEVLKLEHWDT